MTQRDAIWKNRIIGQGEKPASQFLANDKNWRLHPQAQREALHGALNEVGWVAPVIENRRTGMLVDGHERVWQALQNGDASVPFVEVDLDEAEEAYVLATLDPIGAMAAADAAKLDDLLRDVQSGEAGVQQMLAEVAARAMLYKPVLDPEIGTREYEERDIQRAQGVLDVAMNKPRQQVAVKSFDAPPLSFGQALLATSAVAIISGFIGVFGKVEV